MTLYERIVFAKSHAEDLIAKSAPNGIVHDMTRGFINGLSWTLNQMDAEDDKLPASHGFTRHEASESEYARMVRGESSYGDAEWITCPSCNGSGEARPGSDELCARCGGKGEVPSQCSGIECLGEANKCGGCPEDPQID